MTYQKNGVLEELYDLLVGGWPTIVSVETKDWRSFISSIWLTFSVTPWEKSLSYLAASPKELPYWQKVSTRHVVVIVGMDQDHIYLIGLWTKSGIKTKATGRCYQRCGWRTEDKE